MAEEPFPTHLPLFDAHCHPTDTMTSISSLPTMKTRCLTIMATRSQDQSLVSQVAETHTVKSARLADWRREECVIPAYGWHPWFSYMMYISDSDDSKTEEKVLQGEDKINHYLNVLQPSPKTLTPEIRQTLLAFPSPQPLSTFLSQTKSHLLSNPYAIIGEIGLDRSFRLPEPWTQSHQSQRDETLTPGGREGRRLSPYHVAMSHQRKVFEAQLRLAAELGRAVSVHGVQAHGVVWEVISSLWKGHEKVVLSKKERKRREEDRKRSDNTDNNENDKNSEKDDRPRPYPPRIALHSFSGTTSTLKQYLHPSIPAEIFFSFSTAINLDDDLDAPTPEGFKELVREIPDHMILVESDLHTAGEEMDKRIVDIVMRVCDIKGWGLEEGVRRLGENWGRWVFGDSWEGVGEGEKRGNEDGV